MAILAFEGWDHYRAVQDMQSRSGLLEFNDVENTQIRFDPGRGGIGNCLTMSADSDVLSIVGGTFAQSLSSGFVGVAVQFFPRGFLYHDFQIVDYLTGVAQLTIRFGLLSGAITVYSGDPLYTTASDGKTPEVPDRPERD